MGVIFFNIIFVKIITGVFLHLVRGCEAIMSNNNFTVQYVVGDIIFLSEENDFVIFKAKNIVFQDGFEKELTDYIVKGTFKNISKGDSFKSSCEWVLDQKYGWQLKSLEHFLLLPSNVRGIKRFLKKFIKGIGKVTTDKIVKAYGVSSLDKIKEDISYLTNLDGVGIKKAESIRNQVLKYAGIEELSIFLYQHNITNFNDIVQIYEASEDNALDKIKANPYCICDMLSISKLPIADTIALNSGVSVDSAFRISKIILYYLTKISYSSGHMYEIRDVLKSKIISFLDKEKLGITTDGITDESISEAFDILTKTEQIKIEKMQFQNTDSKHSYEDKELIYLTSLYTIEVGINKMTKALIENKNTSDNNFDYDLFFSKYNRETGIIADKIQESAVINALEYRFSILTGGPGTGKTQTVKEIISALYHRNKKVNIALCSPTGRAAKRMNELTGQEASTIHRLLNLTPNENSYVGEADLSDIDYIICDEASMIDAPLFYKLLSTVVKNDISLVLVGDKDQLPPVGPGLPFKDLVESGKVPITVLQNLFRQAKNSQINTNAKKILSGETRLGKNGIEFDKDKKDFFFFVTDNISRIQDIILKSIDNFISAGNNMDDIIVLSPMYKSPVGSHYINQIVQEHINPRCHTKNEITTSRYILREGDRVMQIKNNYDLNVFNGDIGKITKIDYEEEEIIVSFEDTSTDRHNTVYSFIQAEELELAYSITIHKAQGCEFPCVLMPLNPVLVNLSRNILYTSITRAKRTFVFIGDMESLKNGICKTENMNRNTMLKLRLAS